MNARDRNREIHRQSAERSSQNNTSLGSVNVYYYWAHAIAVELLHIEICLRPQDKPPEHLLHKLPRTHILYSCFRFKFVALCFLVSNKDETVLLEAIQAAEGF